MDRNEAAEALEYHKDELKGHLHDAMQIVRGMVPEMGEVFETRAERYWGAHISGAIDDEGRYGKGSMFTMQDTINELMQADMGGEEEPDNFEGEQAEVEQAFARESVARKLVSNLTEGEGTPGYDVPHEEQAEIRLANDIIKAVDSINSFGAFRNGLAVPRINNPRIQLHLDEIRKFAEQLLELHSPESTVPA